MGVSGAACTLTLGLLVGMVLNKNEDQGKRIDGLEIEIAKLVDYSEDLNVRVNTGAKTISAIAGVTQQLVKPGEPTWWCIASTGLCYFTRNKCRADNTNEGCLPTDAPYCADTDEPNGDKESACMLSEQRCKRMLEATAGLITPGSMRGTCYRADHGRGRDIAISFQ